MIAVTLLAVCVSILGVMYIYTEYVGPPIPSEVASPNNAFAIDMYKQIATDSTHNNKNIFFSPFGFYTTTSFLYEGAHGDTASQMAHIFGFEPDDSTRHELISNMSSSINRYDPHATLVTANALWLDKKFESHLLTEYVDIIHNTYTADIGMLDFRDSENSSKSINNWVNDKTYGKIREIVDPYSIKGIDAILNNVVYFKGTWATKFEPALASFWQRPDDLVRTNFMTMDAILNYAELDGIQILEIPYHGDRLSMLVFLPSKEMGIDGLENILSLQKIYEWKQNLRMDVVTTIMPKFTTSTNYLFNNYLESLGMQNAFDKKLANFSGMEDSEYSLYVSKAMQSAFVNVNEKGSKVADDVTSISIPPADVHSGGRLFHASHPFIFVIQDDESGTILFMGRLSDPTM